MKTRPDLLDLRGEANRVTLRSRVPHELQEPEEEEARRDDKCTEAKEKPACLIRAHECPCQDEPRHRER